MEAEVDRPIVGAPTGRRGWLLWFVALAALGAAVFSTYQWRSLAAEDAARQDVAAVAASFAETLTTWDADGGLDGLRASLRDAGTGEFVDEVDDLFGGTLGADLEAARASSEGEVRDVFVQSLEGDRAEVFVVVDQVVTSELSTQPQQTLRSARIGMVRQDGRWKVASIDLINDDVQTPVAPAPTDPEGDQEESP